VANAVIEAFFRKGKTVKDLIYTAYDIHRRYVAQFLVSITLAIFVLLSIAIIEGCSFVPYVKPFEKESYDLHIDVEQLGIDMSIVERLQDGDQTLNTPFREQGVLAIRMRITNNGKNDIELFTRDIVIDLDNGERIPAIQQIKGYSLVGNKFYDLAIYKTYGFSEKKIQLEPKESKHGVLFFRVGEKYEEAARSKITIQFSKLTINSEIFQYKANLR
jgi:hypothetical protein